MNNKNFFILLALCTIFAINHDVVASSPAPEQTASGERQRPRFNFSGLKSAFKTSEPGSPEIRSQKAVLAKVTGSPKSSLDVNPEVKKIITPVFQPVVTPLLPPSEVFVLQDFSTPSPCGTSNLISPYSTSRDLSSGFARSESMMSPSNGSNSASFSRSVSVVMAPELVEDDAVTCRPPSPVVAAAVLPLMPIQERASTPKQSETCMKYFLYIQRSPKMSQAQWQQECPNMIRTLESFKKVLEYQPCQATSIIDTLLQAPSKFNSLRAPFVALAHQKNIETSSAMHLVSNNAPVSSIYTPNFDGIDLSRDLITFRMHVAANPNQEESFNIKRLFTQNALRASRSGSEEITNVLDATFKAQEQRQVGCAARIICRHGDTLKG